MKHADQWELRNIERLFNAARNSPAVSAAGVPAVVFASARISSEASEGNPENKPRRVYLAAGIEFSFRGTRR